jgi:hypothetical protein
LAAPVPDCGEDRAKTSPIRGFERRPWLPDLPYPPGKTGIDVLEHERIQRIHVAVHGERSSAASTDAPWKGSAAATELGRPLSIVGHFRRTHQRSERLSLTVANAACEHRAKAQVSV